MPTRRTVLTFLLAIPLLAAADVPQGTVRRDPRTLRVMSYNIHVTRGADDKCDPARIAEIIKRADVDVVALQEVDVNARRTGKVDQPAELARLTGMHVVFGKAIDNDGGDYGQAILSRQPIIRSEVHKLPAVPGEEQRIAVVTEIDQPKPLPNLLFVGTHLHYKGKDVELRLAQATELNRFLKDRVAAPDRAALLLGDFNATPDSEVMKQIGELWTDPTAGAGPTVPAEKPNRKIDYVLLPKGHNWKVVSAKVLDEPVASDHRPVVVELRWTGN